MITADPTSDLVPLLGVRNVRTCEPVDAEIVVVTHQLALRDVGLVVRDDANRSISRDVIDYSFEFTSAPEGGPDGDQ